LKKAVEKMKINPAKTTVAIQSFGNAGLFTTRILSGMGYRITAVSDSRGEIVKNIKYQMSNKFQIEKFEHK